MDMDMNATEQLEAAASWLNYQHGDLSFGLKSPMDAIKLWKAWTADPRLPEFCDEPEDDDDAQMINARIKKILGYDPFKRALTLA